MHTRTTVTAALLLATTVTACGGDDEPGPVRVTATQTVTATPSALATSASGTNDEVLKMGTKKAVTAEDTHATVQALEYQQPYQGPQPAKPEDFQGGDIWATARVKVCNVNGSGITVDQFPWSLAYKDGTSIGITGSTGGDLPKPEHSMGKTLKPGRCAAGLIAFPVPSEKRPEHLVYEPEGREPTEWAVPDA